MKDTFEGSAGFRQSGHDTEVAYLNYLMMTLEIFKLVGRCRGIDST